MLVLLAVMALPAMASTFAWSGKLTYGFITDFSGLADSYGDAYIHMNAKVDDNNTIDARLQTAYKGAAQTVLQDLTTNATINAFTVYIDRFYMVNSLGNILGIADMVNPVITWGWYDVGMKMYGVSNNGAEKVIDDFDPGTQDTVQIDIGFVKLVNLLLAFQPTMFASSTTNPWFVAEVYGTIAPISFTVAYTTEGKTFATGDIGLDVGFSQAFGDITLAADVEAYYDLDPAIAGNIVFGAGLKFAYTTLATVGVGYRGTNALPFTKLVANINIVPVSTLGFDVGVALNGAAGAAMFDDLDVSAWVLLGAAKFRLGYLYVGGATASLKPNQYAPTTLYPNGGLYMSMQLGF